MDENFEQGREHEGPDEIGHQGRPGHTVGRSRPGVGYFGSHEGAQASPQEDQPHQYRTTIEKSRSHCHGEESFQSTTAVGTTSTGRC